MRPAKRQDGIIGDVHAAGPWPALRGDQAARRFAQSAFTAKQTQVTSVEGLREALADVQVHKIEVLNSLWLDSDNWPFGPPLRITRNVTISSPDTYKDVWPSLHLNYLSNRIQLAPLVTFAFTRVFVHHVRRETLMAYGCVAHCTLHTAVHDSVREL